MYTQAMDLPNPDGSPTLASVDSEAR